MASIVLFAAGYSTGRGFLLYPASLLAALVIVAAIIVRVRRPRMAASRSFSPHVVAAGSPTRVTLTVRNRATGASPPATWHEALPWTTAGTPPQPLKSLSGAPLSGRVSAAATASIAYTLRPPRRGIVDIGPLALDYRDPFGLVACTADVAPAEPLIVTPAVESLPDSGLSIAAGDGTARVIQRRATGNDDDLMTREYRRGDALRRVHWRASARHGELMVRQEEQRTFPEARIILETRRTGYLDVNPEAGEHDEQSEDFEWAVRMVASLGAHLHHAGFLVSIAETGPAQIDQLGDVSAWSVRDEEFLVSLAGIRLTDPPAGSRISPDRPSGDRGDGSSGPLFAVIADPDRQTLDWLASQRRPFELAVAFIVSGRAHAAERLGFSVTGPRGPAVDALESLGWMCVVVHSTTDIAAAWRAVVAEAGTARVDA